MSERESVTVTIGGFADAFCVGLGTGEDARRLVSGGHARTAQTRPLHAPADQPPC